MALCDSAVPWGLPPLEGPWAWFDVSVRDRTFLLCSGLRNPCFSKSCSGPGACSTLKALGNVVVSSEALV